MINNGLLSRSFVRFLIVGGINTLIGLGVTYLLMHAASLAYWPATFTGNTAGAAFSYFMNRTFTFRSTKSLRSTFVRFALVIVSCYIVSFYAGLQLSRWFAEMFTQFPEAIVKDAAVLISTAIYTITNYAGQKLAVFHEPASRPADNRPDPGNGE